MFIYLSHHFVDDLQKSESQTGETRGGKYVARVQIGTEKDGSPRYRYFKTQDEYESYLAGQKGKKERAAKQKKQAHKLETKVKEEQRTSKLKQEHSSSNKRGRAKKDVFTNKSLTLYLGEKK